MSNNEKDSKYYAVQQGRNPGIYDSWNAAREQVDGYKGAVHQSFKSPDDASTFTYSTRQNTVTGETQSMGYQGKAGGSYGVRNGVQQGVYDNWAQAEDNVRGYPGAEHQRFNNSDQAKQWVNQPASGSKGNNNANDNVEYEGNGYAKYGL